MKQIMARTDNNQERMAINLKEMATDRKRGREQKLAEMNTRMEANTKEMKATQG
jgi:hypothetical protein